MGQTVGQCRDAARSARNMAEQAASRAGKQYWTQVAEMWEQRARKALKQAGAVDNTWLAMMTGPDCPEPVRWGNDQVKCPRCGRMWDTGEERPQCT